MLRTPLLLLQQLQLQLTVFSFILRRLSLQRCLRLRLLRLLPGLLCLRLRLTPGQLSLGGGGALGLFRLELAKCSPAAGFTETGGRRGEARLVLV